MIREGREELLRGMSHRCKWIIWWEKGMSERWQGMGGNIAERSDDWIGTGEREKLGGYSLYGGEKGRRIQIEGAETV